MILSNIGKFLYCVYFSLRYLTYQLYILTHLIFTTMLWDRYYYWLQFQISNCKFQHLVQGHTTGECMVKQKVQLRGPGYNASRVRKLHFSVLSSFSLTVSVSSSPICSLNTAVPWAMVVVKQSLASGISRWCPSFQFLVHLSASTLGLLLWWIFLYDEVMLYDTVDFKKGRLSWWA